jgi:hypothetical protein
MGNIMDNWDDEWKIPPIETKTLTQRNPKVYDVDEEEEEEEYDQEKWKVLEYLSPSPTPCNDRKRREPVIGRPR